MLTVCMLNPSTADENTADPTITRVVGFATDAGMGGVEVVNAFSLRSTDPTHLLLAVAPHALDALYRLRDERTDAHIRSAIERSSSSVLGWGAHLSKKPLSYRVRELQRIFGDSHVYAWERTKNGHPKHPLYIARSTQVTPWIWDF
ncbi:MAG: hypothetical protein NVSMB31_14000 [Vulcanimicrobiaceae bacterium]